MELQFVDRVLSCSDCRSDFIFTAGEQLFFFEKQFKNDPKRCKNCKARRAGLAATASGAERAPALPARTETRTHCSDCGIETTVPFKPTQGRPVLCRQCYQNKLRTPPMVPAPGGAVHVAAEGPAALIPQHLATLPDLTTAALPQSLLTSDAAAAMAALPANAQGQSISPEAALLAATSISVAPAHSSVATLEDLGSIVAVMHPQDPARAVQCELLNDLPPEQAALFSAMAETVDA